MNAEVERIRALYATYQAAEYSSETDAACKALVAEVPGLLRMIERQQAEIVNRTAAADLWMRKHEDAEDKLDAQQAVIDAAGEVAHERSHFWYQDAGSYCVEQDAFEALKDTLAALEGGVDGE